MRIEIVEWQSQDRLVVESKNPVRGLYLWKNKASPTTFLEWKLNLST